MNESNLSLAPNLQPLFPKSADTSAPNAISDSRGLFYKLVHISGYYNALPECYLFLKRHFQSVNKELADRFSAKYNPAALNTLLKHASSAHPDPQEESSMNGCLLQYAPIYFTELSWLAGVVQTATNQTPLAIELMGTYLRLTDGENSIPFSREIYRAYLLASGIELPPLHTAEFAKQPEIGEEIFDFAAIQLALAQFPRVFFPEILGFTLSYCQSACLLEQFFPERSETKLPGFIASKNNKRKLEVTNILTIIKTYLSEFDPNADGLWQRVQTGFWLHQQQLEICGHRLTTQLHTSLSPRQAMEKLFSRLIPNAIGHHGKIRLGGKTIDEWFKETPFKSANFLASLMHTPYVDRTKPENSKLLQFFEFGGPMFGVLDENGKAIIKNWLLTELNPGLGIGKKHISANYKVGLKTLSSDPIPKHDPVTIQLDNRQVEQNDYAKLSNREIYYYLVNNDLYPEVLLTAQQRVNRVLTWAKYFRHLPFRHYTHQAFEAYIKATYQREVDAYKPLHNKPKLSQNAYVWGIEQFAPTILTDGCWLQGIHQLDYFSNHYIGSLLQKIYRDETGNGILEQNHPHIYQELLDSLAIKLPPIHSNGFINHPTFLDSAFDIPVYLMAISKLPSAFLPELLGLNMAIEISGLGRVYLRLSEELKFWGINSAIVDIHTSIDNLSTGHSALAIKAIEAYLDEVSANYGEQQMQAHWLRIFTGYCSLQTASMRFKFSLTGQYFLNRPSANNNNQKAL